MNRFLILLVSLISASSFATEEILSKATPTQPVCYGREYSAEHMKSHPDQLVQKIQAKFHAEDEYKTRVMELEVTLKGENNLYTNYRAYFINFGADKSQWGIECDGGHARTSMAKDNKLVLENLGFVIQSGCDSSGETDPLFLMPKAGGDDKFEMIELPKEFCQNNRLKE